MTASSALIPDESLRRLHSEAIDREAEIRDLLGRAQREKATLHSRLSRVLERQTARIEEIDGDSLILRTRNFDAEQPAQIFLTLPLGGRLYFFSVPKLGGGPERDALRVSLPKTVFYAERRDRERRAPREGRAGPTRVALRAEPEIAVDAEVADFSVEGLLVRVPERHASRLPNELRVAFLDGPRHGQELFASVKHQSPERERPGWRRIGLSTSAAARGAWIPIERRDSILPVGRIATARRGWERLSAGARVASTRTLRRLTGRNAAPARIRVLRFENDHGEHLSAIVDGCGEFRRAPLVLIPPAWAKTKETLLPLALTVVETFRRAGESVVVVRLDGIRRRGESYNDPECLSPGRECHHLTFSQGVADIRAALYYFDRSEEFHPSAVIVVSFSGASVEARRALVAKDCPRVGGWVSVVGAADLKSGLRTVSGGVDYIGGSERGVSFGIQRILGIEVDVDRLAADALTGRMAYLEDARCDMAKLDLPITWIQGEHDAWIEPARVREILSCGDASRRRLIEVPTGHQLRTSKQALETFQLIAQEIGEIALGRRIGPVPPDFGELERRREAEHARLPKAEVDLKAFWRDYLLGRDRKLGMELLTASTPYRNLMRIQLSALALRPGDRVADLGSGTGAFPLYLLEHFPGLESLRIDEIDYVREALARARERVSAAGPPKRLDVNFLECDLDPARRDGAIPVADGVYDALIASLLLNYVKEPDVLLRESLRLLRRGGRIVLSTLRRDADISRIYQEIASELRSVDVRQAFGADGEGQVDEALQAFLNEAARLLDLEEKGIFRFWDVDELVAQLRRAGFTQVATDVAFGDPPQAIVASAVRP